MTTNPHDANAPTAKRKVRARERERLALQYRIGGLTFVQIGEKLGVSYQAAHKLLKAALEKTAAETSQAVEQVREMELRRLDTAQAAIWGAVLNGDVQAVDRLLKIQQRRAAYLGLDAPTRQEVTAKVETVEAYDYGTAIAPLAPRSMENSDPSGEDQSSLHGETLREDLDGG